MNVHARYREKLTSPDVAVRQVNSGDWVDYNFCLSQPVVLDEALARRNTNILATGPSNYTNEPTLIAKHPNFVAVNSCVEDDVLGQVASETAGRRQISGSGGQLDFLNGGYLSAGGMSYVCCTSAYTDRDGKAHSRIRLNLPRYGVVTAPRTEVHCVTTEWGIAERSGRSIRERAERLINIAHPDFRRSCSRARKNLGSGNGPPQNRPSLNTLSVRKRAERPVQKECTMARVEIREERCKGCGLCMVACPKKILEYSERINQSGYHPSECVKKENCIGCAMCARTCPDVAIDVYK